VTEREAAESEDRGDTSSVANPAPEGSDQRAPQPLSRTARFAWGMVIIILIAVIALVIYALTAQSATPSAVTPVPAPANVVHALAQVPPSTFDAVGAQVTAKPTPLTPPRLLAGQGRLALDGKPEVLFIGAEYCPFCAAERWPLILALSRFGRFSGLDDTQSAGSSVFSSIQTFSFQNAHFSSPYLAFVGTELYSNELNPNGTFMRIASLTSQESVLVDRYGAGATSTPIPFLDIANRMVANTSAFSPGLLTHQTQAALVASLDPPMGAAGEAIVAAANQLTAGLCLATDQQPKSVCASKGVQAADSSLGIN
jgi:Domain of unknown function (DUF929)